MCWLYTHLLPNYICFNSTQYIDTQMHICLIIKILMHKDIHTKCLDITMYTIGAYGLCYFIRLLVVR